MILADRNRQIGEALESALGRGRVSLEQGQIERHSFDALRPHRGFPLPPRGFPPDLVVTPRSTDEVIQIVAVARRFTASLIPWGGGTGLMGGAVAADGGDGIGRARILVDFRRMNKVMRVDATDQSVRAQSGAALGSVNRALRRRRLFLGHDPWTRDYATVGGAISTNGLGYYGGRYGTMGDQVLGLQAVLADGTVVDTTPVRTASTGLDLKRLFIGTEGSLGLITEATIRCHPAPATELVLVYSFSNFAAAFKAAIKMRRIDLNPTSMEVSGEAGPRCTFYAVFTGPADEVKVQGARCTRMLSSAGGVRMDDAEGASYWAARHRVADFYEKGIAKSAFAEWRGHETFDFLHVALPAGAVPAFRRGIVRIAKRRRITIDSYGIWIEPGLFSADFTRKEDVPPDNLRLTVDEGSRLAIRMGGSFEYCHGVGLRLGGMMRAQHGRGLDVMRTLKEALDPKMLLNPGKLDLG